MSRSHRLFSPALAAITLMALFVAFTSPTFAAEKTRTFTQEQMNKGYVANAPRSPEVSGRGVNLKPGQVVISETWKSGKKDSKESKVISIVLQPTVKDGRIEWKFVSATVNGQAANAELKKQIQGRIASVWERITKEQVKPGRVVGVTITENDITYTIKTEK